jgi:hypothetical protein
MKIIKYYVLTRLKKILILFTIGFILNVNWAQAQTIITVEPGDGTLSDAILAADSNDVLQLSSGGIYTLTSESTFGKIHFPLTIEVEPNATEKAKIQLGAGASVSKKYYFFVINDSAALTLKGLDISGLLDSNAVASSMLVFDARPDPSKAHIGNFRFEDCIFHDFKDYIVHGMKNDYARGLIQDSVFINNVTVYNAKHFLQYKHVSLHHLEMTNTTVYHLKGMALKIGKIGYRCVLQSPNKPYIPISDETITPTGFIDHCTLDDLGDIHGHVQVDNAYHTLVVSNSIISNQQQFKQPPLYFLDPIADTAVIVQNTCFWNCGPPNDDVGGSNWIGYQFLDTMIIEPNFLDPENGDFTLPEDSPLLTAGTNRDPIGDLRWVPESALSGNHKDLALNAFNYPNPFVERTNISFNLKEDGLAVVRIMDINGTVISTLFNDNVIAGKHVVSWEAEKVTPGVYFYQINANNHVQVYKMLIL